MTDPRAWTRAALIGSLWGALELSLGSVLHLSRLPLTGLLMAAIGLVCLLTLRRLSPLPGVCLVAGAVALVVKVFGIGGLRPGPLIGIAAEAVLVELAVDLLPRAAGAAAAGSLVFLWNPLQKLAMTRLVAGRETVEAAVVLAGRAAGWLGFEESSVVWIAFAVLGLLAAAGSAVGLASWWLAGRVARRLGLEP